VTLLKKLAGLFSSGAATASTVDHYRDQLQIISDRRREWSARGDAELRQLRPEAIEDRFALAAVASERVTGMRPFDVQVLGALAMHHGNIAEMQTGEGKTLAAVMTVYANALDRQGAHVWTANDYLARRDAKWMGPVYEWLGLSTGFIGQGMTGEERRRAYACDITYATANEAGFDYLRDGLVLEAGERVQRPFNFVLIDEADSILIDEARSPLVIAGEATAPEDLAYTMAKLVAGFRRGYDFETDEHQRNVQMTDRGIAKVEACFGCGNLYEPRNYRIFTAAQDAIHAAALLRRDVDYIVRNDIIEQVDEFTGRVAQDRRWPAGLQTAVEAKERVPLRKQGRILGSITLQNLVAQYPRVCGMTGTAATQADEFRKVYSLDVVVIPTNRPMIREDLPDIIYEDKLSKERALLREIVKVHATGRPVLIGTASVEESERIGERARQAGIEHNVLNARNDEAEARIIARAGELGAVTISTNMAGRGTDIPLGGDAVRALGGLYVIGTNKHESRRIDNQLRGRAGRQGDPGSSRFFVSLDDDLLHKYGVREALTPEMDVQAAVDHVQRIVEGQNLEIRRTLWKYEGLVEQHRSVMAERRLRVLDRAEASVVEQRDPERWQALCERWGEDRAREVERSVTLVKIDDIWCDYLAAIAELRGGIHWVSWSGKDPLHSVLTRAEEIFEEVRQRVDDEVLEAMADDAVLDRGGVEETLERGATWTYLINDQPFGTMQERWAKAIAGQVRDLLRG
jgi:preprotein translocase subunit SecA